MTLRVLSVAAEVYPLVKTGGLADVVGALPAALAPYGVELTTLVPGYPAIVTAIGKARVVHRWPALLGAPARLLAATLGGHPLLVLDAPPLFARPGALYGHADDWRRFAALARAAADLASGAVEARRFAVLHAHDWHVGLAPAYLRHAPGPGPVAPSIVTIHNIAFQGRFAATIFPQLGLPAAAWAIDGVEYYGDVGYLKAGLQAADAITTVSPTYAAEIGDPRFGMGLEGLIEARRDRVLGIVNGIDRTVWNAATDPALAARYDSSDLNERVANKRAIEAAFALQAGDGPVFTVISRLTAQKGMDVLIGALDGLVARGGRLALIGSGDCALEQAFAAAARRHAGRIGVRIGFDEPLSHVLQGGGDAILIPSRFEPCGLTQLYALGYGCVPIVARTGGLADTVIDANEAALAAGVATGFQMGEATPAALDHVLDRAMAVYATPARWTSLQRNGMSADFSWARSGRRYAALYASLTDAA